jgi:chromosome segregation ATPase
MLEKKLLYFSKPLSEDKLREEIMKLQNEKMQYQTSAKQALKKVYNERLEAIQKLGSTEKALCSTEDECSLLRDQVSKSHSQSRETNERLDAMQNQMDIKISDYEEKIYKKEAELKNLNSELNELQEKLTNYKVKIIFISSRHATACLWHSLHNLINCARKHVCVIVRLQIFSR